MGDETMLLKDILETFFVRAEPDPDRVNYFVDLYKAGAKLPPLWVTKKTVELKDGELIDGRNRRAALERLGRTHASVERKNVKTREEAILLAFSANVGGPKPPTQQDFNHTIFILLKTGASSGHVAQRMHESSGIPLKIMRRYVSDVQSHQAKLRLTQAKNAVADGGLTVSEAAKRYNVDVAKLRTELRGKKKKNSHSGFDEIKRSLSKHFNAFTARMGKLPALLTEAHGSGELKSAEVESLMVYYGQRLNMLTLNYRGCLRRFEVNEIIKHSTEKKRH